MTSTAKNSKPSTAPKGRATPRQSVSDSSSAWADRWITIQWVLVGVAAVGLVVLALYVSRGSDTTPVHGR